MPGQNSMQDVTTRGHVESGRHHELRKLLVSAADAARNGRQAMKAAVASRPSTQAIRDRLTVLLASAL
jgi:hypothetical protein